ncbi:methylated-DNA-[protein]-cysteine S-methyltransferase [Enhydrobacter aerosaccus]|uniref:Methylated-DNA--protein-cysteine methyltransferase n=1 Tax=Enhydrobacter aerosaccus TaxID=225324 RepID=A0A1T4KGL8_9HYPH|nr:methylated-DNA--[protein]-cysteine S-methyltransferase [Enhydrobacter aerosaccus]SJZ41562.1 methylated-DNA-[protein]-cysteine S-methyltransferase [Enhydrobacter aerosaccus]
MAEPVILFHDRLATPIGELIVIADGDGKLRAIDWTDHEARMNQLLARAYGSHGYRLQPKRDPGGLTAAMRRYFKGEIAILASLPAAAPGTAFQTAIWKALRRIEDGATISYAELARRIGKPKAIRAAGLANGQNPVSIVVPCHRVIGSDGSLTGYGGGLERKRWLLAHEGVSVR